MGLLRRKERVIDLGPSNLLPAGDPGCWLVRTTVGTSVAGPAPMDVHLPAEAPAAPVTVAAFVETPVQPEVRPARAHLAALTANLSV